MAVRPCPNSITCPGSDDPVSNYSSEGPEDQPTFVSRSFPRRWDAPGCSNLCTSIVSQEEADLCAMQQQANCCEDPPCPHPPPPPPPPPDGPPQTFCNTPQTCNGHTVPAGIFCAETQAIADALALAFACEGTRRIVPPRPILFGGLPGGAVCLGVPYSAAVAVSGGVGTKTIEVVGGALPGGILFTPGTNSFSMVGLPTTAGDFIFAVQATDQDGNTASATFAISVLGFTNGNPPDGTVGTPYSFQFTAAGGTAPYSFTLLAGILPDGLTLNTAGLLSGTPTTDETEAFTVLVSDASGATCFQDFAMVVIGGCADWTTTVWGSIVNNGGHPLTGTFAQDAFTFTGSGDANGGLPTSVSASCDGTLSYKGPGCDCNLHLDVSFSTLVGETSLVQVVIYQDGNPILGFSVDTYGDNVPGVYDIPFSLVDTLGLTSALAINVQVYTGAGTFITNTINGSGQITNLP